MSLWWRTGSIKCTVNTSEWNSIRHLPSGDVSLVLTQCTGETVCPFGSRKWTARTKQRLAVTGYNEFGSEVKMIIRIGLQQKLTAEQIGNLKIYGLWILDQYYWKIPILIKEHYHRFQWDKIKDRLALLGIYSCVTWPLPELQNSDRRTTHNCEFQKKRLRTVADTWYSKTLPIRSSFIYRDRHISTRCCVRGHTKMGIGIKSCCGRTEEKLHKRWPQAVYRRCSGGT